MVERHESLRTTFSAVDGRPSQRISPKVMISLPIFDLSAFTESEQEDQVQRFMSEERKWICELNKGPLLRTILLQLDVEDYVLLLTLHHIISDAWSSRILFRELATFYKAYSTGKEPVIPKLPIPVCRFCDVAARLATGRCVKNPA